MSNGATDLWDTVAVLTLFDAINSVDQVDGNLKVQKSVFLAELEAKQRNLRAANFRFFRYTYGPYSPILAQRVAALERSGILTHRRVLTKRGRYILDYAADQIAASAPARAAVDLLRDIGNKYGRRSGPTLRDYVYRLTVPVIEYDNAPCRVRDISFGVDILDPKRDHNLSVVAPFDSATLDELRSELGMPVDVLRPDSPEFKKTIAAALDRVTTAAR